MNDPFLDSLETSDAKRGPFRTAEPTDEKRFERAREQSFERVRQATAEEIRSERNRAHRVRYVLVAFLALSCSALAGVGVMAALGESSWIAWVCPALAAVISFGFAVWRSGPLPPASRARDDESAG